MSGKFSETQKTVYGGVPKRALIGAAACVEREQRHKGRAVNVM